MSLTCDDGQDGSDLLVCLFTVRHCFAPLGVAMYQMCNRDANLVKPHLAILVEHELLPVEQLLANDAPRPGVRPVPPPTIRYRPRATWPNFTLLVSTATRRGSAEGGAVRPVQVAA